MGDILGGDFSEFEREARRLAASLDDNTRAVDDMQRRGGASRAEIDRELARQRVAREGVGVEREPTRRGRAGAAARLRQADLDFDRAARATEQFARRTRDALHGLGYAGRGPERQLAGIRGITRGIMDDIGRELAAETQRRRQQLSGQVSGATRASEAAEARRQAALEARRLAQAGGLAPRIDTSGVAGALRGAGVGRSALAFPTADAIGAAVGRAVAPMYQRAGGAPNVPRGGEPPPPPPRGGRVGGGGGDDGGDPRRAAGYDRVNESIEEQRRRLYGLSAAQAQASNAMRRHGALTTEFVQAAARGEATMREMGFQVGATTAKFAGWLAAGSAVFFALDAVRDIGRGAIDSASGVNQLDRVMDNLDKTAAQSSFRDMAGYFNLPINDVADAAFQMGKVFRDQNQVMEATRAVLYSVRVGEMSVADSSRFLIATINGFGLPASRMATLFDQINQAQNKFGVQIRETEAGLAKASGTYRAAGGDVTSLIALLTTAQKVTGQSGEVVGTAIARAPNFLRYEKNVNILRDFGIDATAPIPEIFQKAFERARHLSGQELQVLASAIGGPQYGARVFTGLLANGEKFRQVMRQVNVEASEGSGQRELKTQLDAINEEMASISVSFERLGSALESSGALTILEGMVHLMGGFVDVVTFAAEQVDRLPDGLDRALLVGGQLYLVMRALQRLRFGDFLAGQHGQQRVSPGVQRFFNEPDERYQSRLYRKGLAQHLATVQDEVTRAQSAQFRAQQEHMIVNQRTQPRLNEIDQARRTSGYMAPGLTRQETLVALAAEEESLINQREQAKARVLDAEYRHAAILSEMDDVERRTAEASDRANRRRGGALAAHYGTALPGSLDVGTMTPRPYYPGVAEPPGAVPGAGERLESGVIVPPGVAAQQREAAEQTRRSAETTRRSQNALTQAGRNFSRHSRILGGAMTGIGTAATAAANAARGLPGAVAGAGRGLRGMRLPISGLDAAIIGLAAAYFIIKDATEDTESRLDALRATPKDFPDLRAKAELARREMESGRGADDIFTEFGRGLEIFTDPGDWAKNAGDVLSGDYESPEQQRRREAREVFERFQRQRVAQIRARAAGTPIPYQFTADIHRSAEEDAQAVERGQITIREFRRRMAQHIKEMARSQEVTRGDFNQGDINREVARLRAKTVERDSGPRNAAQWALAVAESEKRIEDQLEDLAALAEAGVATDREINRLVQLSLVRGSQTRGIGKRGMRARYAQAGQQIIEAMQSQVTQMNTELESVDDPAQRQAIIGRTVARLRRTGLTGQGRRLRQELRRRIREAQEGLKTARERLKEYEEQVGDTQFQLARQQSFDFGRSATDLTARGFNQGAIAQARADRQRIINRLKRLRAARDAQRGVIKGLELQIEAVDAMIRDFRAQEQAVIESVRDQEQQQQNDIFDLQTQVQANRITIGPSRTAYILRRSGEAVSRAIQQHGENSQEALQAILGQQEAQGQHLDALLSGLEGRNELASARAYAKYPNDRRRQSRAEIAGLQRVLAFYRAHPTQYADRIPGVLAEIIRARADSAQGIIEQEQEWLEAMLEYRQSQTGSELRRARIETRFRRRIMRETPGDTRAERLRQRSAYNNARRSEWQLESQEAIDRVQFQQDIGKLTTYAAIRQYQMLLRTAKLSRDQRRDLKRRIHQLNNELENENQFDLTVGNVRLPTAYDIRRTIGGEYRSDKWMRAGHPRDWSGRGVDGRASVVNAPTTNNVSLTFNGPVNAQEVFDEAERRLGTSVRGSARAAGQGVFNLS